MSAPVVSVAAGTTSGRRREIVSLGLVTVGALAATVVVATIDPNEPGHYPTCPFLAVSGLFCPGCGSMRALHALTRGDLGAAVAQNPLMVLAAAYIAVVWATWVLRVSGVRAPRVSTARPGVVWAVMGSLVLFGILRNLPGLDWLAPA